MTRNRIIIVLLTVATLACVGIATASESVRTEVRWLFSSRGYKAKVLAQLPSEPGSLKHAEWEAWGWACMSCRSADRQRTSEIAVYVNCTQRMLWLPTGDEMIGQMIHIQFVGVRR